MQLKRMNAVEPMLVQCIFPPAPSQQNEKATLAKKPRDRPVVLWPQYHLTGSKPTGDVEDPAWLVIGYNELWLQNLAEGTAASSKRQLVQDIRHLSCGHLACGRRLTANCRVDVGSQPTSACTTALSPQGATGFARRALRDRRATHPSSRAGSCAALSACTYVTWQVRATTLKKSFRFL